MRLKYSFEIMEVEGQSYAVPLEDCGKDFSGVIRLNGTAAIILELLKAETDEASIVEYMGQRFDVSKDIIAADVHQVIAQFEAKGLLA